MTKYYPVIPKLKSFATVKLENFLPPNVMIKCECLLVLVRTFDSLHCASLPF